MIHHSQRLLDGRHARNRLPVIRGHGLQSRSGLVEIRDRCLRGVALLGIDEEASELAVRHMQLTFRTSRADYLRISEAQLGQLS